MGYDINYDINPLSFEVSITVYIENEEEGFLGIREVHIYKDLIVASEGVKTKENWSQKISKLTLEQINSMDWHKISGAKNPEEAIKEEYEYTLELTS